jgi:predicted nucleic acid-binding Zn ribbon protein
MPIFEYKCNKCETTKDKLVSRSQAEEGVTFPCDEQPEGCDGTLVHSDVPTAAALRFKGRWFATTRGY